MTSAFREQMRRLMGLRFVPADLTTHWEALADIPDAVLSAAVTHAQKTRVEFPTPVELRQDADVVAHLVRQTEDEDRGTDCEPVRVVAPSAGLSLPITRIWKYYCEVCSDQGWASFWCGDPAGAKPWHDRARCERRKEHMPHEWVKRCLCYESNPALVRRREASQKYAEPSRKHVA